MNKGIILSRNYRDWIWREIEDSLEAEKNKEIHEVIFGKNGDLFNEAPNGTIGKLHAIYNIILRYEEVYHDWDLRLHCGKTAEQEQKEEQNAIDQKTKELLAKDEDEFKKEILRWSLM